MLNGKPMLNYSQPGVNMRNVKISVEIVDKVICGDECIDPARRFLL